MQSGNDRQDLGSHFTEAIAHWQLALQTELKRASSLPTAMFDACDPMLEARLCQATEGIFLRLLELGSPGLGAEQDSDNRRLEIVSRNEIAAFLQRMAGSSADDDAAPDLVAGEAEEFHGILVDAVLCDMSAARVRAEQILQQAHEADPDALALLLAGGVGGETTRAAALALRLARGRPEDPA